MPYLDSLPLPSIIKYQTAFPWWPSIKESACKAGHAGDMGLNPGGRNGNRL